MSLLRCPECRARFQPANSKSRSVRCPKCQSVFSPDDDDDEFEEEEEERPRKKSRNRDEEDDDEPAPRKRQQRHEDDEDDRPARKKQRNVDEDDEDDRPARKKHRQRDEDDDDDRRPQRTRRGKTKRSNALLIGGIVGGVLGLILIVGLVVLVMSKGSSSSSSGGSGTAGSAELNEFAGDWPNMMETNDTIILHITGIVSKGQVEAIEEQLEEIVKPDKPVNSFSSSGRKKWESPRLTFALTINPYINPEDFAKRVKFGQVVSVNGHVISINGKNVEPLPSEPMARAMHDVKSKNPLRRSAAVDTLIKGMTEDRRAEIMKVLEPMVDDPDVFVSGRVIETVCTWATKDTVPTLLKILNNKEKNHQQRPALMALARLRDTRGIDPIVSRMDSFFTRNDAKDALIAYGSIAEDAVLKQLNHKDVEVQLTACQILGKIGTKNCVTVLEQASRQMNQRVRDAAASALADVKKRL